MFTICLLFAIIAYKAVCISLVQGSSQLVKRLLFLLVYQVTRESAICQEKSKYSLKFYPLSFINIMYVHQIPA